MPGATNPFRNTGYNVIEGEKYLRNWLRSPEGREWQRENVLQQDRKLGKFTGAQHTRQLQTRRMKTNTTAARMNSIMRALNEKGGGKKRRRTRRVKK
jgi:hypothetical protein